MPETYNEDAVQQILKLAMVRQGQDVELPRSQLIEIAEDLGITESTLAAAEEEWKIQQEEQQAREDFEVYRHQQLRRGIVRFLIVNSTLVLINLVFAHRINWAVYPTLIWGMAIALQAWQTYQTEGEEYDRAFRRWRLRQQIGESFKAISERFKILRPNRGSTSKPSPAHSKTQQPDSQPLDTQTHQVSKEGMSSTPTASSEDVKQQQPEKASDSSSTAASPTSSTLPASQPVSDSPQPNTPQPLPPQSDTDSDAPAVFDSGSQ